MRPFKFLTVLAMVAITASCSKDDPISAPAIRSVAPASGVPAAYADVVVGTEVPISVIVSGVNGPAANVAVTFAPSAGGSVTPATVQTGADGKASASWKLAATVGGNTLAVTAAGRSTTFTASTRAGAAAKVVPNAGMDQSAIVGTAVAVPPSVKVTDANDNIVATPTAVTFTVTSGGGKLNSNATAVTVQTVGGIASVTNWILGSGAGTGNNTLTVTTAPALAGNPLTFAASGRAGVAATLAIKAGNNQSAIAGTTVAVPPSVLVKDALGNPVPDVDVTFTVTGGGGTVAPALVKTDATGTATVSGWVLGTVVGANALSARATGVPPVSFSATGTTGAAARIEKVTGDNLTAAAGTLLPTAPAVRVTDSNGNVVANAAVTFAVASGGGTIVGDATVKTDAQGIATVGGWKLGPAAGEHRLLATSGTLVGSPLTFTATAIQTAATIAVHAGNDQRAIAGAAVAVAPSVIVKDALGHPIAGAEVTFAVSSGGGVVAPVTPVKTNAQGIASATSWTLGKTVAGNPNTLTASVAAAGVAGTTISATAIPGPAAKMVKYAGDNQVGGVGLPLPIDPTVRVLDANDNPVGAGTRVTFAVTTGGGAINGASMVQTNAAGLAMLEVWVLGGTPGANAVTASSNGLAGSPVTFNATAIQSLATMQVNAGNGQVATAGSAVVTPPSVFVRDGFGNPMPNIAVTFSVTGGGGAVAPVGAVMTNALGVATLTTWTLGTTVGPNTLQATAAGIVPVTFSATGVAGPAAQLTKHAGDAQTAVAGYAVATAPAVRITDSHGNPVAGVSVTFGVASGGGSISGPATVQTNASGIATVGGWILGTLAGANSLSATSGAIAGSPATFTATGTAPVPASITINAGNNQTASVAAAVATAPSVVVRDVNSNPINGANVTFAVTSGGGSITGSATVTTNASGIATVGGWTLGTTAGSNNNTLSATVGALPAATFTASATAGAAATLLKNSVDPDSGAVFDAVRTPSVKVVDQYNNPVQGVSVSFAVTAGGGNITGANPATTDASGIASLGSWTLGNSLVLNTVSATSGALTNSPQVFTAYVMMDYDNATYESTVTAAAGDSIPVRVGVFVRDANNQPIANQLVTFTITQGGGRFGATGNVTQLLEYSGPLGRAQSSGTQLWYLGSTPGPNTVTATTVIGGRTYVLVFRATGT